MPAKGSPSILGTTSQDTAHPGRCHPPTIRALRFITRFSSRICGSFDHSHPNTSRGQEEFYGIRNDRAIAANRINSRQVPINFDKP
eukprot:1517189-Pyramimonas_sp.AAC.2